MNADARDRLTARDALLPLLSAPVAITGAATAIGSWLQDPELTPPGLRFAFLAVSVLLGFVLGPLSLRAQRRRPLRSPGRLRWAFMASLAMVHAALALALEACARWLGYVPAVVPIGLLATALSLLTSVASCWPLIPKATRGVLLFATDLLLLVATGFAISRLPGQPDLQAPATLQQAVARHTITTVFALRMISRLIPVALDMVEGVGFRALVAARHLRSKKSGFLAAISVLSVLSVTVSSCALTTTLSVMGGFRQDLKRKILGNNAHIVVDREYATIEGWDDDLTTVRAVPGVKGAAPYVSGEVMISSASNLGTAVLRGIDPQEVGAVNDLPKNLRSGRMAYLSHPEQLLDMPLDVGNALGDRDESVARGASHAVDAGIAASDGEAEGDAQPTAAGQNSAAANDADGGVATDTPRRRVIALEEFLRDAPPAEAAEPRELLPGIIIGQELARSLRVYLGDEVNVVAPLGALGPSGPMPKSRPFRVAGIFYSGMYEYDMKFTYVTLETAQRFLGVGEAISGIEIRVSDVDRAPQVAATLRKRLRGDRLRVQDWQELNSRLFGALALEKLAMFIALGIAILVASFCIAGTLTLMVQEKGREVAILKAMGTTDRSIIGVFVIEGGLIGVLGAAMGLLLGYMMCFAAEHFGIRMNPEVYYIDRLPVHVDPTEFGLTGLAAVLVCLLITVYPALLASRLRPVEALRYE